MIRAVQILHHFGFQAWRSGIKAVMIDISMRFHGEAESDRDEHIATMIQGG